LISRGLIGEFPRSQRNRIEEARSATMVLQRKKMLQDLCIFFLCNTIVADLASSILFL
jgi:hypothetical protein